MTLVGKADSKSLLQTAVITSMSQKCQYVSNPKSFFLSHTPTSVRLQVLILGAKTKQVLYIRKEHLISTLKKLRFKLRR